MRDFRLTLTDQDKREELKLKALQSIASTLDWIWWALVVSAVWFVYIFGGRK